MIRRPRARRRHVQLARILLGQRQQLRQILGRQLRPHLQHQRRIRHRTDRRKVPVPLVRITLKNQRRKQQRAIRSHEQGVAVRVRARHLLAGNHAARARLVLHDERLPQRRLQTWRDQARRHVHIPAGRVGHNDLHGLLGPGGMRHRGKDGQRHSGAGAERGAVHGQSPVRVIAFCLFDDTLGISAFSDNANFAESSGYWTLFEGRSAHGYGADVATAQN
ncbi:hypothetical protein D3C85_901710 [compost metagenome]